MKQLIVSDASPLIALAKLDNLELLFCAFTEIHIPKSVYFEATADQKRTDAQRIIHFVKQHDSTACFLHADVSNQTFQAFRNILDEGESQALALAQQLNCGVLIDENLGRKIAQQHDIPIIGVLGILLKAKQANKIDAVKPLIDQLLAHKYRLSTRVIEIVLKRAGE